MHYSYNQHVNQPLKVFGIPVKDLFILFVLGVGVILIFTMIKLVFNIPIPWSVIGFLIVLWIVLILVVRFGNKKNHPTFLQSLASYRFLQPKKIRPLKPEAKIASTDIFKISNI